MDERQTPQAHSDINPWNNRMSEKRNLSVISDAGNQISCKRTRLESNLFMEEIVPQNDEGNRNKMLFIKRNDEYVDMFKEGKQEFGC